MTTSKPKVLVTGASGLPGSSTANGDREAALPHTTDSPSSARVVTSAHAVPSKWKSRGPAGPTKSVALQSTHTSTGPENDAVVRTS